MRVVSLLPSATEIVAALGAANHLVGVTHECDHPTIVGSRARVTSCRVNAQAAPSEIDAQVRTILINAVCQLIIFLYLLDNETSMVVLGR